MLRQLIGPSPDIAKRTDPDSVNARFGEKKDDWVSSIQPFIIGSISSGKGSFGFDMGVRSSCFFGPRSFCIRDNPVLVL